MKRELAALEAKALVLESNSGKTRASKQQLAGAHDPNAGSVGLVYKRIKRSNQVKDVNLSSIRSKGAVAKLNGHDMLKMAENTSVEREDRDNGASVSGEMVGLPEPEDSDNVAPLVTSQPVERDTGVNGECSELVVGLSDEGLKNVGEHSIMEVERKDDEGNALAVKGGAAELQAKEDNEEVSISRDDDGALRDLSTADNGLVVNVQTDEEMNDLAVEEQNSMPGLNHTDVSLMGAGDPVIVDAVNDNENDAVNEVDKERVLEGTLANSPNPGTLAYSRSKMVKGREKNSPVQRYSRRFTRSALKSKEDVLVGANDSALQNKDNENAVLSKSDSGVGTQLTEDNGEFKNLSVENNARRFTRSSLKPKVDDADSTLMEASDSGVTDKENAEPVTSDENVEADMDKDVEESLLATPKRKMEMKMSKQIGLAKIPTTVKELFETGLLEGCPVYHKGSKGPGLRGRIRGLGILCSCGLCQGCKVIPPSLFEIHATNTYKRAAQYICLENGRSFIDILKLCKNSRQGTLEATVLNAIGPLPEKKLVTCQNCKEPFPTMDTESSEAVCSSCVMSNASPIGPVFSGRRLCRPSKSVCPLRPTQAASACDVLPDRSSESVCPSRSSGATSASDGLPGSNQKKLIGKRRDAFPISKLRSSPRFGKSSETKTAYKAADKTEEVFVTLNTSSIPSIGKSPGIKACEQLMENPEEECLTLKSHRSPSRKSLGSKSSKKQMKKPFKAALSPKVSGSTRVGKSLPASDCGKTTKRLRKEVLTTKPVKNLSGGCSSEKKISGKITRKDLRLHKLVFEDDVLPDGTELAYYVRGQKLLTGYKKGFGIFCNCCDAVVSASQFEAHAGCAKRRKPYCYIYTSNGVSLHELSINLIKGRTHSTKFNDDLCSICADGGNLLLCDGCPRAFHMECASLSSLPRGKWYCKYCQNMFEREKFVAHNANAVAAGRVTGVDPMEQISTRSIRIVDNMASELSSCILCRGYDFCKSGFGPRTIILCDQCEKEYHVGCLKDHNMADLKELPEGKWFCSIDCGRIDSALQNVLVRGAEKLPDSLADIILKKLAAKGSDSVTEFDVSWRLLSGKIASPETRPLLSQAVSIFHESFSPIIDAMSGQDLIAAMVYGRSVAGQEYGGMYCAVLTVNSVVVSAGIFRVFGSGVAELPLVATSTGNQGKGYFQALFACIERLLAFLQIKSFVLPAAEEAESIWTDRFGFTKMTPDELCEFKRNYWSVVRFQGTSMLHKPIPECRVIQSREV